MNRILVVAALSLLFVASAGGVAEAKTWKGIWDGNRKWSSTLVFLEGRQLIYCFQSECTKTGYRGDAKGTVRFNWGRAKFTFKWTGTGYRGARRAGNVRNTCLLK